MCSNFEKLKFTWWWVHNFPSDIISSSIASSRTIGSNITNIWTHAFIHADSVRADSNYRLVQTLRWASYVASRPLVLNLILILRRTEAIRLMWIFVGLCRGVCAECLPIWGLISVYSDRWSLSVWAVILKLAWMPVLLM